MLSANKRQLAIAERVAICVAAACMVSASLSFFDDSLSKLVLPVVLLAMGTMFYLAFLIAGLASESSRALGKFPSPSGDGPYSSIAEIRKQLQWSPKSYKIAAMVATGGLVGTAVGFGAVSWSTSETFTSRHSTGASLYLLCILVIELPFIASASRMPGTFQDHVTLLGNGDA